MYDVCRFGPQDASALSSFLNDLRTNHWPLTSLAYQRKPARAAPIDATELIESSSCTDLFGTFLLRRKGQIISMLHVHDKHGDGKTAVFRAVETHPSYQRRGIFARALGESRLRKACHSTVEHIELTTWTFNRKGIPLYKRAGFRAVPGTSLLMENYLPLILKHPSTGRFFAEHDYIRTLQNQRSYGYDAMGYDGLSVFEYSWKSKGKTLRVLIDWQRKQIASIERDDRAIACYVVGEHPLKIRFRIENRSRETLPVTVDIEQVTNGNAELESLHGGMFVGGDIDIHDPPAGALNAISVVIQIGGERVPFRISRSAEECVPVGG